MYGPTETTIWSTTERVTSAQRSIPIGRPIAGTRVYVLDRRLEPVPYGVAGDLYIGGDGLARGYLHLPGMTADAFRPDPHTSEPGARMYRTGDLARMRADGVLEFVGRGDDQVKLRGFRIELGDVEAALAAHPSVSQAVAGLRTASGGDAVLAAWLVPADGHVIDAGELRGFLRGRLPEYMVPSLLLEIESLPLTPNGKIDRRALPDPVRSPRDTAALRAPSTETERTMMQLWREMLGSDVQGLDEDFFDLGGHSMLAARLLSRVRDVFGTEIPLRALFEAPTVAGLARSLDVIRRGGALELLSPALRAAMLADTVLDPAIQPARVADRATPAAPGAAARQHVLLTGATGFLGAHLLAQLLASPGTTVTCLVRCHDDATGAARLREILERFEIWDERYADRIAIVPGDLDRPRLGLTNESFAALGATLDAIYHNGALVNFVTPYRQLRPANILGTIEVLRLAAVRPAAVHYVSTTDVLGSGYYTSREDDALDEPAGLRNGYAQSKWVAEHLVRAARARGLSAAIYRPGRIIGHSRTGIWNTDDFACRAIRGSIELGVVPDIDPLDSMSPVDFVAAAITSIARGPDAFQHPAFHVINPEYFLWRRLFDTIRRRGYPLDDVPYGEWRRRLAADASNPLAPLLPLFPVAPQQDDQAGLRWTDIPVPNCARAQAALDSTEVRCPALDDALWDRYFEFFMRTGYITEPPRGTGPGGDVNPLAPATTIPRPGNSVPPART
jgi:thioester reductase-like protein